MTKNKLNKVAFTFTLCCLPFISFADSNSSSINNRKLTAAYTNNAKNKIDYIAPLSLSGQQIRQYTKQGKRIAIVAYEKNSQYLLGYYNNNKNLQSFSIPNNQNTKEIQLVLLDTSGKIISELSDKLSVSDISLHHSKTPKSTPVLTSGTCNIEPGENLQLVAPQTLNATPKLYANGNEQVKLVLENSSDEPVSPSCTGLKFQFSVSINGEKVDLGDLNADSVNQGLSTPEQETQYGVKLRKGQIDFLPFPESNLKSSAKPTNQQKLKLFNLMDENTNKKLRASSSDSTFSYFLSINNKNFYTINHEDPYPLTLRVGIKNAKLDGDENELSLTEGNGRKIELFPTPRITPLNQFLNPTVDCKANTPIDQGVSGLYQADVRYLSEFLCTGKTQFIRSCPACSLIAKLPTIITNPELDSPTLYWKSKIWEGPFVKAYRTKSDSDPIHVEPYSDMFLIKGLILDKTTGPSSDGLEYKFSPYGSSKRLEEMRQRSSYKFRQNTNLGPIESSKLINLEGVDLYGNPIRNLALRVSLQIDNNGFWKGDAKLVNVLG